LDDLVKRLRAAGRHPMMDNTCKVDVFDVNDAAARIAEFEKERDAMVGRLERALEIGADNRVRADRLAAMLGEAKDAAECALRYIENSEAEWGDEYEGGKKLRAFLARFEALEHDKGDGQ
jgi:hypothetical protein